MFSAIIRTTCKVTKNPADNKYIATKFRIPKLAEGKDVFLTADDVLDQKIFPFDVWFTQAGTCFDGMIIYGFGVGQNDDTRPSCIRIYDTDTGEISARYEMQEQIFWEIEDIAVKDGWMYVNTNSPQNSNVLPVIYKVSLPR